jgi:excisionase family DNA binding protein
LTVPTDPSELLTLEEVGKLLKLSLATVRREASSGSLPTVKLGRSVRVRRRDLDSYIEARLR